MRNYLFGAFAALFFAVTPIIPVKTSQAAEAACPAYDIFGRVMSDICWDCMFPITVAGVPFGGGSKPPGAASPGLICSCSDKNGVPWFGFPYSSWQPARLVEVVRRPYCSPTLGGSVLQLTSSRLMGGKHSVENRDEARQEGTTFMNYHYFAFPLDVILNMFSGCASDGYMDFDLMYLSEVDPTWNEDQLAFFTNPEVTLVATPVAQAACIGDALAANAGLPSEMMWWCAGSWGGLYPFSGNIKEDISPPQMAALITTKAIAALHRRLLAWKVMGDAQMCKGVIYPSLPKTQYKLSQLYPLAEANNAHWIGESAYQWGEWRNIPGVGEDFVEMIWRWNDCCVQTF